MRGIGDGLDRRREEEGMRVLVRVVLMLARSMSSSTKPL